MQSFVTIFISSNILNLLLYYFPTFSCCNRFVVKSDHLSLFGELLSINNFVETKKLIALNPF